MIGDLSISEILSFAITLAVIGWAFEMGNN